MTTSSNHVEGQPAFVVHSLPYKDTSHLVDYFSQDFGRIRLVVKGARRARSRLRDGVQPFQPLEISWRGRTELKNLTAVDTLALQPFLQGRALWCGLYLNELLMRLLPAWDAFPRLFAYYRLAVSSLNDAQSQEAVLRVFERRLLEELGFAFSYTHAGDTGESLSAERAYGFDPEVGFVSSDNEQAGYPGDVILAIGADDYRSSRVRQHAKRLMRSALQPHLGHKPLRSRALFQGAKPVVAADRPTDRNPLKE